ncbi:hypothetical protein BC938DRAFT_474129 [Jimgerdemannia flammicorona]|uniref:Uncharacterized protein n=1 Tax=Jimgerdemannia flammicorona TaxID=994334 RepID=A0A433Q2T4_9FUNG|nr:hypothetical protein BC938DRAFT_474129 [Jimgerdemannia flammicorona]
MQEISTSVLVLTPLATATLMARLSWTIFYSRRCTRASSGVLVPLCLPLVTATWIAWLSWTIFYSRRCPRYLLQVRVRKNLSR